MTPDAWYYFVASVTLASAPMSFATLAAIARRTRGTTRGLRAAYDAFTAEAS